MFVSKNLNIEIKKISKEVIKEICVLHKTSFDDSHFTLTFDNLFLEQYYENLIQYNEFSYVAIDLETNKLAGYIIGGDKTSYAVDIFIKKNILKIFFIILKNPKFIFEKIRNVFNRFNNKKNKKSNYRIRVISIAVNPLYKGKNISNLLLDFFERNLIGNNIFNYGLSVRKNNERAIKYYLKNGFQLEFEDNYSFCYYKLL